MRTEKWLVLCVVLLLIQLVACERGKMDENVPEPVSARTGTDSSEVPNSKKYIITENTTGIKLKEPSTFTFIGGKSQHVVWRTVPAQYVENLGTRAIIYFQNPGKHRILAVDSLGNDTTYIDVEVINETYQIPDPSKPILDDDVISLTPMVFPDTADNLLMFQCVTAKSYPCGRNELVGYLSKNQNSYEITFEKMLTGYMCYPGQESPGTGNVVLENMPATFEGPITINFNGKVYKGSFKRTGKASYEFNWPHVNGVIFTKKAL